MVLSIASLIRGLLSRATYIAANMPRLWSAHRLDTLLKKFHVLDAFRGVAAIAVVTHHFPQWFGKLTCESAYLAVDLFFVMSGVVIAHTADHRMPDQRYRRMFMARRLLRLYPFYAIGTSISLLVVIAALVIGMPTRWTGAEITAGAILAFLFLPTPPNISGNITLYPLNYPAWSLLFEILVNAAYALFFFRLTDKRIAVVIVIATIVMVGTAAYRSTIDMGASWSGIGLLGGCARVTFGFGLGVLLSRRYRTGRLPQWRLPTGFLLVVVLVTLWTPLPLGYRAVTDLVATTCLFPVVVVAAMNAVPAPPAMAKLFNWLGMVSFGLYALHEPVLDFVAAAMQKIGFDPQRAGLMLGLPALAVLLAGVHLIDSLLDKPVQRWGRKRLKMQVSGA